MLVDVNVDGAADALGMIWHPMDDQQSTHLVAVDGKSGRELWRSKSLGKYTDVNQSLIATSAGFVLVASPLGSVDAYEVKTGKAAWSGIGLGEKPQRICRTLEPGFLVVNTADKQGKKINLSSGELEEVSYNEECSQPWMRTANTSPKTRLNKWPYSRHDEPSRIGTMRPDWSIALEDDTFVAFGNKAEGTSVPMVGVYRIGQAETGDKAQARLEWVAVVPAGNPLAVDPGKPDFGHVEGGVVFVSYETKEDVLRVTAFEVGGGNRLWDVALPTPETGSERVSGISAVGESVFVSTWTRLHVLSRNDGSPLFRYGGM